MIGASGRGRPATKYDEVYQTLLERIEAAEELPYCSGNRIPSASSLAIQFGVSPATIARATKRLKDEGYLVPGGNGSPPRVPKRHPGGTR